MRNLLHFVVLTLLACHHLPNATSFSSGAPASQCGILEPSHNVGPQSSTSPYAIRLDTNTVKGGDLVEVTLSGGGPDGFKGFLAIGTKPGTVSAVGTMIPPTDGPVLNVVNCPTGKGMTHSENDIKSQVKFHWQAPNVPGDYVISVTTVKQFSTFWARQESSRIQVTAGFDERESTTALPEVSDNVQEKLNSFYKNCGTTKGCFGLPASCLENKNCDMFTTWRLEGAKYRFQIAGKIPTDAPTVGHVSMGLSFDKEMGQDSVVGCVFKTGENVLPKSYYNPPDDKGKGGRGFANVSVGLDDRSGTEMEGWVFCEFSRTPYFNQPNELGRAFDLKNDAYHILLARAASVTPLQVKDTAVDRLGYHVDHTHRGASDTAVNLADTSVLAGSSNLLIQLHGAFMVIAWVMTSSMGIFVARYYKQTHTTFSPLNKAFWFALHVGSMFLTIGLTFAGVVLIFVEIGGYSKDINTEAGKAHPILGLILTGICGLQLTIGLLRPHPGTPNRPYFNWVHWTAGNIGHIVGVACIFLATELSKSGVQNSVPWLITVIVFVVFHVLMHGILSLHTVWADKQMNSAQRLRGITMGPMKPSKPEEAPGTWLRTFLLVVYVTGITAIAVTLITLLVRAQKS